MHFYTAEAQQRPAYKIVESGDRETRRVLVLYFDPDTGSVTARRTTYSSVDAADVQPTDRSWWLDESTSTARLTPSELPSTVKQGGWHAPDGQATEIADAAVETAGDMAALMRGKTADEIAFEQHTPPFTAEHESTGVSTERPEAEDGPPEIGSQEDLLALLHDGSAAPDTPN